MSNYVGSNPVITNVIPGVGQLTVEFTQSDPGYPSPEYFYSLDGGNALLGNATSSLSLTIDGITEGMLLNHSLDFWIVANNAAGKAISDVSSGSPYQTGTPVIISDTTSIVNGVTVDFYQDYSGNPAPTYYYSLDGGTTLLGDSSSSPITINVTNSVHSFNFRIYATNAAGNSISDETPGSPYYTGSPVIIDNVIPVTNGLVVEFTQSDAGYPTPMYYYSFDGTTLLGSASLYSPFEITGLTYDVLTNGLQEFYVISSNSAGNVVSDISSGMPYNTGSPVIINSIVPGTNKLTVYFTQTNAGNPAPIYYYSFDGINADGSGVSSSPIEIGGLTYDVLNNNVQDFYIMSVNTVGNVVSDISSGTPLTTGSPANIDSIVPGPNSLTVYFNQTDLGNSSPTYYYSFDGTTLLGDGSASSPLTISNITYDMLQQDGNLRFYIVASNAGGNVTTAQLSERPLTTGSPLIVSAVPGINEIVVDFSQNITGNPLPNYYYSFDGTTLLGDGTNPSQIVIPDLHGTTTFYIVASNSVGNLVSNPITETPYYVGGDVIITNVTSGYEQVTVYFTQSDIGDPLPNYYYSIDGVNTLGTGTTSSPLVINGITSNMLTNGRFYFYIISVHGNYSQVSSVTYGTPLFTLNDTRVPCFGEGSRILCFNRDTFEEEYVEIQNIRKGTLVKTLKDDYVPVYMIGKTTMYNKYTRGERNKYNLYKCTKRNYPEMISQDLILTGCHCILVDDFKDDNERENTIAVNKKIYITDNKYRLPACVDERAQLYEKSGTFTIYHLALENDDYYMNYGIYANGLLVETSSKRYMRELSKMEIL